MIVITLQDGTIYNDNSEAGIVRQLKLEDWTVHQNIEEYRANITRRVEIFNGEKIIYGNNAEFIDELFRIGFIKEIKKCD